MVVSALVLMFDFAMFTLPSAVTSITGTERATFASAAMTFLLSELRIFIEISALNSPPSKKPEIKESPYTSVKFDVSTESMGWYFSASLKLTD